VSGVLYGVGVGPGDPELVTVKAARIIEAADVVAFHAARPGRSIARASAAPYLRGGQIEEELLYPVTRGTTDHPGGYAGALADFYTEAAQRLAAHLDAGRDVALLAEGDPAVYSSYAHLHRRLRERYRCVMVPGVSSVTAVATAAGTPLVEGEESLLVLPATLPGDELARRLAGTDAAVIMKVSRNLDAVRAALDDAGRGADAMVVARATHPDQQVVAVGEVSPDLPYMAAVVVPGQVANRSNRNPAPTGQRQGQVVVIGLGPGDTRWLTPEARDALAAAEHLVGYTRYLARVPARPGQQRHVSDNRVEAERAEFALELARRGGQVAVVSSGDPGVFAMAAAVLEVRASAGYSDVTIRVLPGVTAAQAVAARAGAPLGHDYAVISLSDQRKPWSVIAARVAAAAEADLVLAFYNPASTRRRAHLDDLRDLLGTYRKATTPVVVGRAVGDADETLVVTTLADIDWDSIDMRTLLIVGSSQTVAGDGIIYTPRSYSEG